MDDQNRYGTLQVQKQLIGLLGHFDSLCVNNGIRYSLSSGSLLGAVRHGGFIPWDDDVDVTVLRKDFDLLVKAVKNDPYVCLSKILWLDRLRFSSDVGKESAPTIDVFIWDNVPDSFLLRLFKYFSIVLCQGLFKRRPSRRIPIMKRLLMWPFSLIGRITPDRCKVRLYENLSVIGNGHPTRYYGGYHDQFNALRFRYPSSFMKAFERKPFEDIDVQLMKKKEEYLAIVFGSDFMTLPPEEKRKPRHTNNYLL